MDDILDYIQKIFDSVDVAPTSEDAKMATEYLVACESIDGLTGNAWEECANHLDGLMDALSPPAQKLVYCVQRKRRKAKKR